MTKAKVTHGAIAFGEKVYQVGEVIEGGEEAIASLVAAGVAQLVEEEPEPTSKKRRPPTTEEVETP